MAVLFVRLRCAHAQAAKRRNEPRCPAVKRVVLKVGAALCAAVLCSQVRKQGGKSVSIADQIRQSTLLIESKGWTS